jgi:hypothetical protein
MKPLSKTLAHLIIALPAAPTLEPHWERYSEMGNSSQIEELFTTQLLREGAVARRLVARRFKTPQSAATPALKAEWYVRLGPSVVPLTFRDLNGLEDASLFDAALWALLREDVPESVFAEGVDWEFLRGRFGPFLRSYVPKGLFEQRRGSWWRWMRDGGVPETADPLLKSLHRWFKGMVDKEPARWAHFIDAYALLSDPGDQVERDFLVRRIFDVSGARAEREPRAAPRLALAANTPARSRAAQGLLRDLAEVWKDNGKRRFAADALARSFMLAVRAKEELAADEVLFLADEEFEAGEYQLAYEFYTYGRDKIRDVNEAQALEFSIGLARSRWKLLSARNPKSLKDTDADEIIALYEDALERSFQAGSRDLLLVELGEILARAGRAAGQQEVGLLLFKYGDEASSRRLGMETAVMATSRLFEATKARGQLKDYLDYLATSQRLGSARPFLKQHASRARAGLLSLRVLSSDPLWATLEGVERGGQ